MWVLDLIENGPLDYELHPQSDLHWDPCKIGWYLLPQLVSTLFWSPEIEHIQITKIITHEVQLFNLKYKPDKHFLKHI